VTAGSSVFPGLVPSGTSPGTLVAGPLTSPISLNTPEGTISGAMTTSVYREATPETLDFYYQIANSGSSTAAIGRWIGNNFSEFQTRVGYRIDGSSLPGFVNGTQPPIVVSLDGTGDLASFLFNLTDAQKLHPGQTSTAFVISTDAFDYEPGTASIGDGVTQSVETFKPVPGAPEPGTMFFVGAGVLALAGVHHRRQRRRDH
jgi:hypothetical protein